MCDIEKFSQWLKVNGYSKNTRRDYTQRVKDFLDFTSDNIDQENLEKYFLSLKEKYKNKTVNCYRDAIGAFCKFSRFEVTIPKRQKEESIIPDAISFEDFEEKILVMAELTFEKREKVIAILDLMLKSGLRKSEICQLSRKNMDLKNLTGKVLRPKTSDWHVFFFDRVTSIRIECYFDTEVEDKNAFNIGRGGIDYIFKMLKKDFPEFRLRPHLLRHCLATKLLKEGVNLRYIQAILGHKSLNSTMRYTKVDTDSLKKKYLEVVEKKKQD